MSKHPGLNKKPGSWQEKERKKTGAKQSSRPKLRENPGHNKAIRANVPNSHPGLLLRTLEYVQNESEKGKAELIRQFSGFFLPAACGMLIQ